MEEHKEQFLSWELWSQKSSAGIQDNKKAQSDKEFETWGGHLTIQCFQRDTWTVRSHSGEIVHPRWSWWSQQLVGWERADCPASASSWLGAAPEELLQRGIQALLSPMGRSKANVWHSWKSGTWLVLFVAWNNGLFVVWRASKAQNYCADKRCPVCGF